MPESKKTAETQPEKKNGHKPEPQPVVELASEYAGLPGLSADLLKAAHSAGARNEPGEAHAEWLGDRRVRSAQRVALASQIGHVHGNQHLQRVLASMIVTSNAPQAALTAKGNGNGNGRHNSGHGLPVIQREEDSEEGRPTEEEKARALAAAKAAEGVASQAESEGRSQIDKSKVEKNAEQNASQAARGKVEQAKAESATKSGAATGKKAPSIEKVSKEAPAEEKAEAAQAAAVLSPVPGKNGKGPSAAPVEGKAPASASDDPAFQAVIGNARNVGEKERSHAPSKQKADQAQSAAEPPASEIEARAQSNQVGEMERAETPAFDAGAFKASLMKRIAELAPKSMKEADDFKSSNKLGGVKDEMQAKSAEQQNLSKKNLAEKTAAAPDTGSIEPKPVTPLPPADPGAPPPDIGAAAAAPKVKAQSEVEAPLKENTQKVDDEMAEAGVTEEQLAKSNEPEFIAALDAKKEAHRQTAEAPQEYRLFEQEELGKAEGEAVALAQEKAQSMHGDREGLFSQVEGKQSQAKSEDEQAREKVAADLQKIYAKTKTKVETILSELDGKVETAFEAGAAAAKQAFEDYVEAKMEAYKEDRYGGWFGWARWAKDKLLGMPSAVNAFYEEGRQLFIKKMDAVIDNVTAIIATGITEAKAEIANGKKEILEYIAKLPEDLRMVGQKANQAIQEKFDALNETVNSKVDELVDTLANKYQEHLQAVDARIEELKAANAGLVEKAINAVVGAIKIIIQLGELLLNVLARISGIVGDILDDPIGFLGNMIDGIKLGFQNFVKRIKTHLITGLVTWLTGALGPMGIKLPDDLFSLEGIFSLVIQVLGLGWDYIRAKAVKLLGEPVVKALETGFEIFQILISEGPIGLWRYLKEQFTDLKETVLDMIQETIISEVIEAGVNWVLSLLTPAGAFIKAAKAIYKIVTFFFEKAGQIADFINAVIDGVAAVASGSISGAASLIENALAKAIPLIIGFLSNLLGIGDLPEKIHKIIKKVRARIDKAIDGLIMKAKKFARKVIGKLGFGKEKKTDEKGLYTEEDRKNGLAAFTKEERPFVVDGKISHEDAKKVAGIVKQKHPVFQSITVVDRKDSWDYQYVFRAEEIDTPSKKKEADKVDVTLIKNQFKEKEPLEFLEKIHGREFVVAAGMFPARYAPDKLDNQSILDAVIKYFGHQQNLNVDPIRKYRPGWSDETREELAAIYPEKHLSGSLRIVYKKAMSKRGRLYNRAVFNRNHITAYSQIRDDLLNRLHGVSFQEASTIIGNESNRTIVPSAETNESILEAIKALLRIKFNDITNIYLGDAKENQKNGSFMAIALEEMDQALANGDQVAFKQAKSKYLAMGFDPEPIDYFYDKYKVVRERL